MSLVRIALLVALVIASAVVATPSRADHYSGPPDSWTAYWAVPAYADISSRGPEKAAGVIFWSHGLNGTQVQYHVHPPEIIRRLARAGWDVIKVQRNPLFEKSWAASGTKHVADLQQRAEQALAQGYKRIILSGQSYGGAISIEAARDNAKIFAVLAFAPGHGSDADGGSQRLYDNLTSYLLEAVGKMRAERVLVLVAEGDKYSPREERGPKIKTALGGLNIPYVLLDERMPIKSHYVVSLGQFDTWYGACIAAFLDPAKTFTPGEANCAAPNPLPAFLYPADMRVLTPGADLSAALRAYSGIWTGTFDENGMEVSIAIERVAADKLTFIYATGAGPNQSFSMGSARRNAVPEQDKFVSRLENRLTVTMSLNAAGDTMNLVVLTANGRSTFPATLKRMTTP